MRRWQASRARSAGKGRAAAIIAAVLCCWAGFAQAATQYAGTCGTSNNATITAAIAAAAAGDTVLICPGTWNEAVTVNKDNLTIGSSTGNRADVTVTTSNDTFTLTGANTTLQNMTIVSTSDRGVVRGWTLSPSQYTFRNLSITARDEGVRIDVSGKVVFNNVTVTSSRSDAINLGWATNGAHEFDNVTASGDDYGIYSSNGGAIFKDVTVTADNDDAIYMSPGYDATFTNVSAASTSGDGIYLAWVGTARAFSFSNVAVTARNRGIYIAVSGKVTFANVNATSSNSTGIELAGSTNGAHEFDTVTAQGDDYGLYTAKGGALFKDITATGNNNDAIYLAPGYDATFTDIKATSTQANGIYMAWVGTGKTLTLSGLEVTARLRGVYIDTAAAVSLRNSTISSSNSDAVFLGYGAQGAHLLDNLTLDASTSGIRFESAVPSATVSNVCVNSGQYGFWATQWAARNLSISSSKFTSTTNGVRIETDPTYKATVSGNCIMKSTTPRAYSNNTAHVFNGNYWQGVAGGTVYNDGNIRDNSTLSSCPVTSCYSTAPPAPVADYHFDECEWTSGTAGAVGDSSGNAYHGTPYAVNTASGGVIQRGADLSASGTSDYLKWPLSILNGRTNLSVSLWFKTSVSQSQQQILQGLGSGTSDDEIRIYLINTTQIRAIVRDNGNTYTAGSSFVDGAWHHLAMTRNGSSGRICVYLDATSLGCNNQSSGALSMSNADSLLTGQEQDSYGGSFDSTQALRAQIDEFKVFSSVLTSAQVTNIRGNELAGKNYDGTTRALQCSPGPDHIRVYLDGSTAALTCTPRAVTAVACTDSTCSSRYSTDVSVTLNPGGTAATITAGNTGSPTVAQTTAGTAGITLASSVPAAIGGTTFRCYSGSTAAPGTEITGACNLDFSNAGFFVSVPNHVSCTTSTLTITAAKTDDNTKKCVPAFDSGASRTIQLKFGYNDPGSGASTPVVPTVGSASPPTTELATTDTAVTMAFTSGVAATNFRYNDAGKLTVTASYTGSAGTGDAGLSMSTVSNPAFVVAPASFALSGIPAALTAGAAFNVTLTAKNSCGDTTKNFGREATVEGATFASSNPAPALGNATAISQASSAFTDGVASTNLTWNEVGTIDLTATNAAYLGSSDVIGSQAAVGPFRPAYFDTVVTHGCSGIFTYAGLAGAAPLAGQPFTVEVKAKRFNGDADDNTNTRNYAGATWAKAVTLSDAAAGGGTLDNNTFSAADFADGVATRNDVTYAMAAKLTAPYALAIRAVDADGVTSEGHTEGSTGMRSGRLRLSNAFGTERSNLAMPVQAQYWSGNSWVLNGADICTVVPQSALALSSGITAVNGALTIGVPSGGNGVLNLNAPGAGVVGSVDIAANMGTAEKDASCLGVPADRPVTVGGALPWLRSRNGSRYPDGSACPQTYDRDPSARATFGVYPAETRRTVHVREAF